MRRRASNLAELVNGRVHLPARSRGCGSTLHPQSGWRVADVSSGNAGGIAEDEVAETLLDHLTRMAEAYQAGQSCASKARTRLGEARVMLENLTAADQALHDIGFVEAAARLTKAHILSLLSRSGSAGTGDRV